MSLSVLQGVRLVADKLEQLDAEIDRLQDEAAGLTPTSRSPEQIEALLTVAQRKRRWYAVRQEYLSRRQEAA